MKLNKKPVLFILLLVLITIIGSTYALYSYNIAIPNKYDIMTYKVKLEDDFNGTWGERNVKIKNIDDNDTSIVIRINFNETWSDNSNNILSNVIDEKNVVDKNWTDDFLNNFELGADGWYYYNKILLPQESVQILNGVELDEQLISSSPNYSKYMNYNYDLSFNYESTIADEKTIKTAWGKEVVIEKGEIRWG